MTLEYICIAIVAFFWGAYPLVARSAGIGGPIGALLLTLSALIPIVAATLWQGNPVRPTTLAVVKLIVAGIMMGCGLIAFNTVANSKQIEASVSIPIMDTGMLLVTVIGAILFFAEPITTRKLVGLILLIVGILVLRPE